ncbi:MULTISPECIES: adenosylcobinamide-GDP ribazoletransferase [Phaeobacter]|uniref:Adenosylcobinamide-GDP ribazoletransferase n=1 Tax=Phaeobacter piscinae TaxID=1580596 RepID=A0ABN5DCM8_9RHOB|nr:MULTISPECIES: adenosylcobinamide-GDP ribazoletransferase [Phaeobacter]ATG34840.1 putative cobalamin-5-phosphate synthase [Phaeobacter piscinae]ATG38803.1 putative cobalamin-5-phosphate synthase [Phaeobacter piscinae]AUQ85360.1 putative cobalamin-5-phosphate synthase [Phaeobacter piscinae]AUR23244.1 putative cobalamin-5-phosphate synthase [Phaeobacter piscinae]KII12620.1 cobalamin biosynthesis protein CobS [Phaeobacter sp. S60]
MRKNDISGVDFLLVLILLTRLPMPVLQKQRFARHAHATWAFPFAGVAVAVPACLSAAILLRAGLNPMLAAGIALLMQTLLTGAMHEDGLADTADGFWGGFTRERRLEIMKDSQIGTYGVLALILTIGLRWMAYAGLLAAGAVWALLPVAMLSRAMMPAVMAALPNARATGLSSAVGRPPWRNCGLGLAIATLAAVLILGWTAWGPLLAMCVVTAVIAATAQTKIGGQTGDVLGATQQLSELVGLLCLTAALS